MFHVVLYQPEIPPNTGNLIRLCANAGVTLHLVHPVQYNLEVGLIGGDVYLDSAWLMVRDVPWVGTLKLGGLDAPIGFDNVVSSRDRTFMEVAAPIEAFVPDDGFMP